VELVRATVSAEELHRHEADEGLGGGISLFGCAMDLE
jgi:hypothetical protein